MSIFDISFINILIILLIIGGIGFLVWKLYVTTDQVKSLEIEKENLMEVISLRDNSIKHLKLKIGKEKSDNETDYCCKNEPLEVFDNKKCTEKEKDSCINNVVNSAINRVVNKMTNCFPTITLNETNNENPIPKVVNENSDSKVIIKKSAIRPSFLYDEESENENNDDNITVINNAIPDEDGDGDIYMPLKETGSKTNSVSEKEQVQPLEEYEYEYEYYEDDGANDEEQELKEAKKEIERIKLNKSTLAELREKAKQLNIKTSVKGRSLSKKEIIEKILNN